MDKLPMCRICLGQNTRMYIMVNKNLRELYEKLTDIPFITADRRPILVCFFCCAKLKQCFWLMSKCLVADELFARIMNKDYKPNPLINPDHLVSGSGFITTPTEHVSITGNCEQLDDIIEPKKEILSDDLEPDVDNSYLDVEDMLPDHFEPDSESDVPLMEVKIKVEESIEVSEEEKTAVVTKSTAELKKKEPSNLKVSRTTRNRTNKPGTSYKERDECDQRILKKTYACNACQRSFSQKTALKIHIRVHTGEKPYECDVCQRSFSQKNHLIKHIRIHTGEKPYKCEICQRSFSETGSLKKHIRTHTGEKPFKCNVCHRGFCESGGLRNHFRIHTGERPFKCDICQRGFSEKSSLTKHFRTHTGEKPYRCGVCPRSFRQKNSLNQHICKK